MTYFTHQVGLNMFADEYQAEQPHTTRDFFIKQLEFRIISRETEAHHELTYDIMNMSSKYMGWVYSFSLKLV